jgi:hypothetical protein
MQAHNYAEHPEVRARLDNAVKVMHAKRRGKRSMEPGEAIQPPPVDSANLMLATKLAKATNLTFPAAENVVDNVIAELRAQEQEEEPNGADPGGNGHQELDLEDADNIYLRTAANPLLRSKAMIPKMERAASFGEAQIAAIVPKTMVINPMLIQVGMGITFTEWGWDPKMSPGMWLDEVLKWFFWYCGYEITPWRRLTPQELGIEGG